jgi:hypothetical protein
VQKEAAGNSSTDESSLVSRQKVHIDGYGQLHLWYNLKVGVTGHEKWGGHGPPPPGCNGYDLA